MEFWLHQCNTIWDIKKACDAGLYTESDVSITKDKRIIVCHPGTLDPDPIKLTWKEASKAHPSLILLDTLLTFLVLHPGHLCCFDIKINSEELAVEVARRIDSAKLNSQSYVTAFQKRIPPLGLESNGRLLKRVKGEYPEVKTHLIATFPFNLVKLAEEYKADMISFGWLENPRLDRTISKALFHAIKPFSNLCWNINNLQNMGVKVMAGIFNDIKTVKYFIDMGVDAVMTENSVSILAQLDTKEYGHEQK